MARQGGLFCLGWLSAVGRNGLLLAATVALQACGFNFGPDVATSHVVVQIPALADRTAAGFLPGSAEDFASRNIVAIRLEVSGEGMTSLIRDVDASTRAIELDVPSGNQRTFALMAFGSLEDTPQAIDLWSGRTTVDLLTEQAEVAVQLNARELAARLLELTVDDTAGAPPRLVLSLADGAVVRPFEEFGGPADITQADEFVLSEVSVPLATDSQLWGAGQIIVLSRDGERHAVVSLSGSDAALAADTAAGLPAGLRSFGGGVDLVLTREGAAAVNGGSLVLTRDGVSVPAAIRAGRAKVRWLDAGRWTWTVSVAGDGALSGTVDIVTDAIASLAVDLPSRVLPDTVAPETRIDTAPPAIDNSLSSEFTFSANEFAVFECSFDGAEFAACESPVLYTAGRGGAQNFRVRAIDAAGNVDATPALHAWTIDLVSPVVSIGKAPSAINNVVVHSIEFTSDDAGATFDCSLDGANFAPCVSPKSVMASGDGFHYFVVRAVDTAGNTSSEVSAVWTLDTVAPASVSLALAAIASDGYINAAEVAGNTSVIGTPSASETASFAFLAASPAADCSVAGPYVSDVLSGALGEGLGKICVQATDTAGNIGYGESSTVEIDSLAPSSSIDSFPSSPTNDATPTFTFSSADGGSVFECLIDSISQGTCSSPYTPTITGQGSHTVAVIATDAAGNTGTATSHTYTYDSVAPSASISGFPGSPTSDTTPTFIFGSPDGGILFTCLIDGISQGTCSSPYTPTITAQGSHTVAVIAADAAGNTGTAASHTYTVDTVAPSVSIDSFPSDPTNDTTPSFTFSSVDGGISFECFVDTVSQGPCVSPFTTTIIGDSLHTVEVVATDAANNSGSAASFTYGLDTTAPSGVALNIAGFVADNFLNLVEQQANQSMIGTPLASESATFSYIFATTGSDCSLQSGYGADVLSGGISVDGKICVRAVDAAGNVGFGQSLDFVTDLVAPTLTLATVANAAVDSFINLAESGDGLSVIGATTFSETATSDSLWQGVAADCAVPSGIYSSASPVPADLSTDGDYKVCLRMFDTAGNIGFGASSSIVRDTVGPSLSSVQIDSGATYTNSLVFSVDLSASVDSVTLQLAEDAGMSALIYDGSYSTPQIVGVSGGAGTRSVYAQVRDAAGNAGSVQSDSIIVDQAAPVGSVSVTMATTNSSSIQLTISALDDLASSGELEMRVFGDVTGASLWQPYVTSLAVTLSAGDGFKTINVEFRDPISNVSATASTSTTLDTLGAGISLLTLDTVVSDGWLNFLEYSSNGGQPVIASLTFDELVLSVEQSLEASATDCSLVGAWISDVYIGDHSVDGAFKVCLKVTDYALNVTYLETPSYVFDTITPMLMGISLANEASDAYINQAESGSSSDLVGGLSASEVATYQYVLVSNAAVCSGETGYGSVVPTPLGVMSDGDYKVCVELTDSAGNIDYGESIVFNRDTLAPNANIDSYPPATTNATTPTFTFSSVDGGISFECFIDAVSQGVCLSPYTPTILGDGSHTVDVKATDAAGNQGGATGATYTLDTLPPTVNFDSYPGNPTSDTTPSFSFTSLDGGLTFACRVDSISQGSCSSPFTPTISGEGWHTVEVIPTDVAGNAGSAAVYSYQLDTTAPQTTIDSGAPAISNTSGTTFFFSADEPGSTFECQMDGGGFNPCGSPQPYGGLSDGSHTFEVRAIDPANNTDGSPASQMWTIDTVAPTASFDSYPTDPTFDATPEFSFSSADGAVTFECYLDAVSQGPCSSPYIPSIGADGSHSVGVAGTDAAGNTGTMVTYTFTLDTAAPTVSIDSYPQDPTLSSSVNFSFSSPDGAVAFECFMDSVSQGPCSSPVGLSVAGEGLHTFEVVPEDAAGNVGVAGSYAFTLDTSAPTISLVSLESGSAVTNAAMINVLVFSPDGGGWLELADDAGFSSMLFANFITAPDVLAGPEGVRTVWARVRDAAGNYSAAASDSIIIDTSGPTGSINIPAAASSTTGHVLSLAANDLNFVSAALEMRLTGDISGGGVWTPFAASPLVFLTVGEGAKTVYVQYRDPLGNLGSMNSDTVQLDMSSPAADITAPVDGSAVAVPPLLAGTASDAGVGVASVDVAVFDGSMYWDGAAFSSLSAMYLPASGTSIWNYAALVSSGLPDGTYIVDAMATDSVGNPSPNTQATFYLDQTPPACALCNVLVLYAGNYPYSASYAVDLTSAGVVDASGPIEMRITGDISNGFVNSWIPYASTTQVFLTAIDGAKTVTVEYRDAVGNVSVPYAVTVTLDITSPNTTIDSQPADPTNDATGDFTFSADETVLGFECNLNGGGYAPCSSPFATTALADGLHSIEIRATDLAGNIGSFNFAIWTLDTVAPYLSNSALANSAMDGYVNGNEQADTMDLVDSLAYSEAGVTAQYVVVSSVTTCNGASYSGIMPQAVDLIADGIYKVCFELSDAAGNVGYDQSATFERDTIQPTISLVEMASGANVTNVDPIPVQVVSPDDGYYMHLASDPGFSSMLFSGLTGTENVTRGSDGLQAVYARVIDLAGNYSTATSAFTVVDTQGPTGSIDITPTITNNSSQLLSVSANDPNFGPGQIQMRISGDVLGGGTWEPYSASPLYDLSGPDGLKTVYVEFKDALGNISTMYSDSVQLDTDVPGLVAHTLATEIGSGYLNAANQSSGNPVISSLTADEPTASTEFAMPDVGTACFMASYQGTIPLLSSLVSDNDYRVCVHLVDMAGNEDWLELDVFTRDTAAPTVSGVLLDSGALATISQTVNISMTVSGADSLEIAQDAGMSSILYSGVPVGSTSVTVSVGDGLKTVYVRAADLAQNYSTIESDSITLDSLLPSLTSISLSTELQDGNYSYINNLSNPSGPAVTDAAFDGPVSLVEYVVAYAADDCSLQSGWTGSLANSALVPYQGMAKICVRIVDLAANVGYGESSTLEVDTVQPVLSLVAINNGASYANSNVVSVATTGSGATSLRIATDAGMTALLYDGPYNNPQTVNVGLGESNVTLYVRLRDNVGNTNGTSLSDSIYRDSVPPLVAIADPLDGVYVTGIPDPVYGTASDAGSGVSSVTLSYENAGWWWNGTSYGGVSPVEFTVAGLTSWSRNGLVATSDGSQYVVRARALDNAGNETLFAHSVTVDQSGPTLTITAPAFGADVSLPPMIVGTAFDAWTSTQDVTVAVFNGSFYWDGAAFTSLSPMAFPATGTDNWSYAALTTQPLADGTYVVDVVATDILGNQALSSTNFTLDQSGPGCGVCAAVYYAPIWGSYPFASTYAMDLTSSGVLDANGPIQMKITGDLTDGIAGSWIGYTSSYPINLMLFEGSHSIYVNYRDSLGNISGPYQVNVTLDATPPTVDSVVLAGGAAEVTVTTTSLLVTASNGPVNYSATGDLQFALVHTPYTGVPTSVEVMPGDGLKTIYVTAFDQAMNQSSPVSATVELDTTPPIANGLLLADGLGSTSVTGVSADVLPDVDAVEMMFTGDVSAPVGWIPYAATSPISLSGSNGQHVLTSFASLRFTASVRASNGDIILAGQAATSDGIAVVRLRGSGEHEPAFGTGGVTVISNMSGAFPMDVSQVMIDSYDNIVLVGNYSNGGIPSIHVTRLFSGGAVDNGFGTGGTVVLNDGSNMRGGAILDMGSFYVVGGSNSWSGNEDALLVFVSAFDGSLRSDIGASFGRQQINGGLPGDQRVLSLAYSQGNASNYFVGIKDDTDATVIRMNYPAFFDNSFAAGELNLSGLNLTGRVAVIGSKTDAGVFVIYGTSGALEIRRYDPSGSLDTSWGASGLRTHATSGDTRLGSAQLTEGFVTGSVRAVASVAGGTSLAMLSAKANDGAQDVEFGAGGAREISWLGGDLLTNPSLTVDPNGRTMLVATRAGTTGGLMRLTASGERDHTFGMNGNGLKIVSVKLRDVYGRESGFATDSVLVDTIAPTGMITTATQYTDQLTNTVFFIGNDAQPVTSYTITGELASPGPLTTYLGGWQSQAVTFAGGESRKWLGVVFVDEANNIGGPYGIYLNFDLTPPVAAIDGPLFTSNTNYVFMALATDTVTQEFDLDMRFAADVSNLNAEPWVPFNGAGSNVFLSAVEGPHVVRLQVRDGMGHMSAEVSQTVVLDMTNPVATVEQPYSMYVSQVADITGTVVDPGLYPSGVSTVYIALQHGPTGWYYDGGSFSTPGFMTYAVTAANPWFYGGFNGVSVNANDDYNIFVGSTDMAGNGGAPTMYSIRIDQMPPTCGLCLDAEATVASGSLVPGYTRDITIDAMSAGISDNWSSVDVMYGGDITDAFAGSWAPYGGSAILHVTAGDGPKTIMVRYRDMAGNMTPWYSDVVTLDTVGPGGFVAQLEFGDAALNNSFGVRLDVTSPEGVEFDVFGDVDSPLMGNAFVPTTQFIYVNLIAGDGSKTVTIRMYDEAGNYTDVNDTIDLDTQGPTGSITGPAVVFSEFSIPMTLAAGDAHGVTHMRFSGPDVAFPTTGAWMAYGTSQMVDVISGDGTKIIYVEYRDSLGNVGSMYSHNLTLDTVPPVAPNDVSATIKNTNTGELYVSWTQVTGATGYEVHYDLDSGVPYFGTQAIQGSSPRLVAGGAVTNITLTGFAPGQEIFVAIKTVEGPQISTYSAEAVTGIAGNMSTSHDFQWAVTGTIQLLATKTGNASYDLLGKGGAIVGDVDFDGMDDYAWGAPDGDHTYTNAGEVRVYSGFNNSPLLVTSANDPASSNFGETVAGWRVDLDTDGRMDYLVADPGYNSGEGRVYAMSGFPGAAPLWTATGITSDQLGLQLISTDDVNGDGVRDVVASRNGGIVQLSGADGTQIRDIPGIEASTLAEAPDLTGDGVDDFVVGDNIAHNEVYAIRSTDGSILRTISNPVPGFGQSVAVGDFDGDTMPDVAVGAPSFEFTGSDRGVVFVYRLADGTMLQQVQGDVDGDMLGGRVAMADMDHDGMSEVFATASGVDQAGADRGALYVLRGGALNTRVQRLMPDTLNTAGFGSSLFIGSFDIYGELDIFVGASTDPQPSQLGSGRRYRMSSMPKVYANGDVVVSYELYNMGGRMAEEVEVRVDGGPWQKYSAMGFYEHSFPVTSLVHGLRNVQARIVDEAGYAGPVTNLAIEVDLSLPQMVNLNSPNDGQAKNFNLTNVGVNQERISVDAAGKIHVAYKDGSQLKYSTNLSGSWVTEMVVGTIANLDDLEVDKLGKAHIIFRVTGPNELRYINRVSGTWSGFQTVRNTTTGSAAMVMDGAGKAHVVWSEGTTVQYSHNVSGSWSAPVQAYGQAVADIDLARRAGGKLYGGARLLASDDVLLITNESGPWTNVLVESTGNVGYGVAITVNVAGKSFLAYRENTSGDVRYADDVGGSFTAFTLDSQPSTGTYQDISLDSSGKPIVTYECPSGCGSFVQAQRFNGSIWRMTKLGGGNPGRAQHALAPDDTIQALLDNGSPGLMLTSYRFMLNPAMFGGSVTDAVVSGIGNVIKGVEWTLAKKGAPDQYWDGAQFASDVTQVHFKPSSGNFNFPMPTTGGDNAGMYEFTIRGVDGGFNRSGAPQMRLFEYLP